jgi:gliding motility-associated-like protein
MKRILIVIVSCIFLYTSSYALHFTIIESQSMNSGHNMDVNWQTLVTGMGHTASVVPQTTLDNTSFFATTDILIISSGVIALPGNRVTTILQFLQTGKPVYLQSEYLSSYTTNQAFASIIASLGGSFTWNAAFNGDLNPMMVLGTYATTNNVVNSLSYYWYSYSGSGDCNTVNMLQYGGAYHGFQYIPVNPAYGTIMSTTDQDWVRTFGVNDQLLMQNMITHLINPPYSQAGIQVSLGNDTTLCFGSSLLLDATQPGSSYIWHDNSTNPTFNVVQTGTYWVSVTNAGCSGLDSIHVTVLPDDFADLGPDTLLCSGGSLTLDAFISGATYLWQDLSSNSSLNVTSSGLYWVDITLNGCTDRDSIVVNISPPFSINLGPDIDLCSGDSIVLDAGAGYSSYAWSPSGSSQTVTVNTGGTYSVTVTDVNSCEGTDDIAVTIITQQDASIITSGPFCSNDSPVQFTAQDPGGIWSGTGVSSGGVFNPSTAGAGVHEIIYTISGSCGDSDTVDVTVYAAPVVNLGPDANVCDGESITLDAGPGSTYTWTPSGSTQTIIVSAGGTYSVVVTDGNGCEGTDAIQITVISQQNATINTTGPFCSNDSPVQFTAQDPGGVWSGTGISGTGMFNPSSAGAGTHTITYGIAGSCGDTSTVQITVNAAPVVNLGPDASICEGESLILDAGPGSSWQWSPSGSTQTINVTTGGTYSVTVTDGNGCEGTDVIIVTVSDNADATILTDGPFCSNDSPVQFQSEDGGGSWSGTGISGSGLFNPSAAGTGTHTITYGIAGNCGDTTSRVITVNEAPLVSITHNNESCIGADDGDAILVIVGGTSPFTILWSNGSSQQTLEGLIPGDYSVLVTDQNGCSNTGSVSILGGLDDCSPPHIYIPNVFSPNDDGENDIFYIRGEGIQYIEVYIYNRWGQKVFESTSQDIGWNGTFKGKMCSPGVFSYLVKVRFANNLEEIIHGTITLVK